MQRRQWNGLNVTRAGGGHCHGGTYILQETMAAQTRSKRVGYSIITIAIIATIVMVMVVAMVMAMVIVVVVVLVRLRAPACVCTCASA